VYIFFDFPLFATLFYTWIFLLIILLFSGSETIFEELALTIIFVLVFSGFWIIISPGGLCGDDLTYMASIHYLLEEGRIPNNIIGWGTIEELSFPAIQLVNAIFSQVCGLTLFTTRTLFLIMNTFIFTLILFVTFFKILKSTLYASIGIILSYVSNVIWTARMTQIIPFTIATTYIATFILLLNRDKSTLFEKLEEKIFFTILILTSTISYIYPLPIYFFFVLIHTFLLYYICKENRFVSISIVIIIIIPIIVNMFWDIYSAWHLFQIKILPDVVKVYIDLIRGRFFLATEQLLRTNIGIAYPWWGNVTRLFWWLLVFGLGSLLLFKNILSFKKSKHVEKVQIGGFLGTISMVLIGALGTRGAAHGGLTRYLWLAPFFLIPTLVKFIASKKYGSTFFFLSILLFSFSMFLTNMDTLCCFYIYPQEHSAGRLIEASYGRGDELYVYSFGGSADCVQYYAPKAKKVNVIPYALTEEEISSGLHKVMELFLLSKKDSLFINVNGKVKPRYELYGLPQDHPEWMDLEYRLSLSNIIYNNGLVQLYTNRKRS
jgi:hypothetical protein